MEEFVGKVWHRWITRQADTHFPEASVSLDEISPQLAMQFRAFGGDPGLELKASYETAWQAQRHWLKRIASADNSVELAWLDDEHLRLPKSLALFPQAQINRDLYLWLAALSAQASANKINAAAFKQAWLGSNQKLVLDVLRAYPGLKKIYFSLVHKHIKQRQQNLPYKETLADEQSLQAALLQPERTVEEVTEPQALAPVPLWLHPCPPQKSTVAARSLPEDDEEAIEEHQTQELKELKRKRGEFCEDQQDKGGLLAFRLESVMSWAEYVPVDRCAEENEDDDVESIANDLEFLSLTPSKKAPASRIKFDLDLPAQAYDDEVLAGDILLPEWNYRQQQLRDNFCSLSIMNPKKSEDAQLPSGLKQQARIVRAHFERLAAHHIWHRGQTDGSEIDIDRYVLAQTDLKHGHTTEEPAIYKSLEHSVRDLSCLLLADLSLSTDAWVNNEARVIDIVRDSLHLFNEALEATGDRYAISGFSSKTRKHVRYYSLKGFNERPSARVRQRINAVEPGLYTRIGAAVRFAASCLEKEKSSHRLLLLLTDGKPNDVDFYEGRYGIEDTRHAVQEAREKGLHVFCVTIDDGGNAYLPYIFGQQHYTVLKRASELPLKLPQIYARLTCR